MKPCCEGEREVVSRKVEDTPRGEFVETHERCKACGANHYTLEVPPVAIWTEGRAV